MLRGDTHENAILTSADWALHTIQIHWLSQGNCWVISLEGGREREWWCLLVYIEMSDVTRL